MGAIKKEKDYSECNYKCQKNQNTEGTRIIESGDSESICFCI